MNSKADVSNRFIWQKNSTQTEIIDILFEIYYEKCVIYLTTILWNAEFQRGEKWQRLAFFGNT